MIDPEAFDMEAWFREEDEAELMREATWELDRRAYAAEYVEVWHQIIRYGGIRPSRDHTRHEIPGGLLRVNGRPADLVAAEAVVGAPWGNDGDSEAMLQWLRKAHTAYKQHWERRPRRARVAAA